MINRFINEYRWLSNFTEVEVWYDGEPYKSVEHAYVAAKTFDKELRKKIQSVPTAGEVKRFGRDMEIRYDWDDAKLGVMTSLLKQKFSYRHFSILLSATGENEIIEGNTWHDNYWGSCICKSCGNKGENHLGKLLMKIRARLVQTSLDFFG